MKRMIALIIVTLWCTIQLSAQSEGHEPDSTSSTQKQEHHKKNAFSLAIGHTHVGEGVSNGQKKAIILPSWGINYDRHISEKWIIGLHTDIIIEEFEVEVEGEDQVLITVERSRPVSMAITTSYRLNNFLLLSAGAGREFAPEEDYTIFRFGIEPYFRLPNEFEIVAAFSVDVRVDAYNAINFGIGIAKFF